MVAKLIGIQQINFTNGAGETINGTNLFTAFKDENVQGLRTEKFFLKDGIALSAKVDDTIEINFNYKGKIEGISKVNQ